MTKSSQKIIQNPKLAWGLFVGVIIVVFILGIVAQSIMQRSAEAKIIDMKKVDIDQFNSDNAAWGKYFPQEYESWLRTQDTSFRSMYAGAAAHNSLAEDPNLVVLWAGYAFSKDYMQARGHYYAVSDVLASLRTGTPKTMKDGPQPATCWTCKSPDVPRLMHELGSPEAFYAKTWAETVPQVTHSVGCGDCHDAKTMQLIITRPALVEALEAQGKDVKKVSHQEMRSLVCAQCHSEYFFNKKIPGKEGVAYLEFPWKKGMTVENMEAYYDTIQFTDFVHGLSKTPILKAQHPDYELYTQGIHAKRGVACADCHMPYKSEGGIKFTDHHIQSPLNNVANSCQVCHRKDEAEIVRSVYDNQSKGMAQRLELEKALVAAHVETKAAMDFGATDEQLKDVRKLIRQAQWRWDYASASIGGAFHAPVEYQRIMSSGINKAQEARVQLARLLAKLGHNEPIAYPDISTEEKAQKYIGLDMQKVKAEKAEWMKNQLPKWLAGDTSNNAVSMK